MVRGIFSEGEGDTPSKNSPTGVIEAISNLSLTPYIKRSIRRARGEPAR
jgi:hypothetical protein